MTAGIRLLSAVMSLLIASLSEITPWIFNNDAAEYSAFTDAVYVDSVLSVPSEAVLSEAKKAALHNKATPTATNQENKILLTDDRMLWPVAHMSEVVSGFPYYSNGGAHHGVDIFVIGLNGKNRDGNGNSLSYGKPFRAAQSGVVVDVRNDNRWNTGFGNYCVIDHGDGTQTLYAHAKTVYVAVGDTVYQGQNLGEIGGTGNTTAPHLHFEVRVADDGCWFRVDPMDFVSEPVMYM